MDHPDLNLLITLDAVLTEGSVAGAARRLGLSASAMSRALARLRETTGDPLLVRAGRGLVPTPRALELREPVHRLVEEAHAALRPAAAPDLSTLTRTFTLRTREGFVENAGAALLARVNREAPGVRLHFMPKTDRETTLLRDGTVDLETGVVGKEASPEVRTRALFRDRFVGVARAGHPLTRGRMTLARYLAAAHVLMAREGGGQAPVDVALEALGAARNIAATTGSFAAALALARASDLVATVPERQTGILRDGMHSFDLPVEVPQLTVSLLWHPRMDADPAHRWLRGVVLETCASPTTRVSGLTFGHKLGC
ncbi:LysR family transcriptional regulator [Massilia sp. BKSP1R2A-1]|uniref:LysR family transcriptional regulator n=1 Tax=Massilia sp. BKSP1R2A-1 TaxID=3422595 RepID=UPI003D359915